MEPTASRRVKDLIGDLYGIRTNTRINPLVNAAQITATRVFNNNPRRLSFLFVNLSANAVYLTPDNQPSATRGIYLAPGGGLASALWSEDFELVTREWFAIAVGGVSSVYCMEVESI
jgi:hypothetical protein